MAKWFPPGYEPVADVFERTGSEIFGARWDSEIPTFERLRTPPEKSEVGAQGMHVFQHLRDQFCLSERTAAILDPDFGPKILAPHWWYDDKRASAAFLDGSAIRPAELTIGDTETIEYEYGKRVPGIRCPIGVRIDGDAQSLTVLAERTAEPWLTNTLSQKAFLKKSDYWRSAQAQFPRLSRRAFDRVWDRVTMRPEHSWIRKPGPK